MMVKIITLILVTMLIVPIAKAEKMDIDILKELLKDAQISINLRETPWSSLPIFIRERIATRHANTLLDMADLVALRDYYQSKIDSYPKDAKGISIAEDFLK